jgi:hypothetical protein
MAPSVSPKQSSSSPLFILPHIIARRTRKREKLALFIHGLGAASWRGGSDACLLALKARESGGWPVSVIDLHYLAGAPHLLHELETHRIVLLQFVPSGRIEVVLSEIGF